jgi:hypothetical protein
MQRLSSSVLRASAYRWFERHPLAPGLKHRGFF